MVFVEFGANLLGGVVGDSKSYVQAAAGTHHQNSNEILQFQNCNHVIDCSVQCRVETRNPGITVTY